MDQLSTWNREELHPWEHCSSESSECLSVSFLIGTMFHFCLFSFSIKCKLLIIKFPSSQPSPEVTVVPSTATSVSHSFWIQSFIISIFHLWSLCHRLILFCLWFWGYGPEPQACWQVFYHQATPLNPNVSPLFYILHLDSIKSNSLLNTDGLKNFSAGLVKSPCACLSNMRTLSSISRTHVF